MLVYKYNLVQHYICINYDAEIVLDDKKYLRNTTTTNRLCSDPCNLFRNISSSRQEYIKFMSVVDIVPSIVKCRLFYDLFVKKGLLIKSKDTNYYKQYLEINNVLYTKYITFKKVYINKLNNFMRSINIRDTVGIHYRMNDRCFNSGCINRYGAARKINQNIHNIAPSFNTTIIVSTIDSNVADILSEGYRSIKYMNHIKPIHISKLKRNITQDEISKTIGDILIVSSANYLFLSKGSTFSFLILSIGGLDNHKNKKNFTIYDENGNRVGNECVDIIEYEMKKNRCIPAVYYSSIKE